MAERRGRRARTALQDVPVRRPEYRNLRNPFTPQTVFSDDEVAALHANALRVLQELGLKVLLPEARAVFRAAGALVDDDAEIVRLGADIVEAAVRTAPAEFTIRGGRRADDVWFGPGALVFLPGAGCPNATDRLRGRRPGSFRDFEELTTLTAGFDVMHMQNAVVEPQDVPAPVRHYATMRHQLLLTDKIPFLFARGQGQTLDGFEMLRIYRGLSHEEFATTLCTKTVINTNSPRQIDRPMAQGLLDFARHSQVLVVTPFCLLGAMAPVTVAGALSLQHAEALAGITLAQLARPGAPVMYGNFASNVDMKSGAPAFGTPEHIKATLGSGQLARHIGLPWRSSAGTAANVADAQAAQETAISAWAAVLAGANMIIHSAGWLEGGLTHSYEKLILDMEMVQIFAELCSPTAADEAEMAFAAIAEVQPGGHFFAADHTMNRFHTAFYEPLAADWSNFGQWTDAGARRADERATDIWQTRLAAYERPPAHAERLAEIDAFIARRKAEGGAPPGE
ncbi:MAG: trimethylamine methyltransferase family protein [Rhodobacter sp.]|nr:trimethylamine methyltransferase family protein [Rhodobacter sp.]